MPDQTRYRVLSLFSGGMGLDLGLEDSGRFCTVACIEKDPVFCETIRANIQRGGLPATLKVLEADISLLDPKDALDRLGISRESIDVVVGGPPCQSFSTAGRRGTVQDARGTLLWHFLKFVEHIRPKFFLMENVRGLLSAALKHRSLVTRPEKGGPPLQADEEPGSVVRLFAKELANMSGATYHLDVFEVNAVNYGAPQLRERALFFGNCHGVEVDFPRPTHGRPQHAKDANRQCSLVQDKPLKPWRTLRDALQGLEDPCPVVLDFSPRKKSFLELVPPGSNWRSLPPDLQKESMGRAWVAKGGRSGWWRRLSLDLPCPTLVTMPNHASTALCHPTETRALSIKEYARIQEFPDEWVFCGTVAEQYAQVGNAVPVRLGEIAGGVLARSLDTIVSEGIPVQIGKAPPPRIVYVQSHVRTRQWYKAGAVHVWADGEDNAGIAYAAPKTIQRVSVI